MKNFFHDEKVVAQAKDTLEALQLFKTDIGTYLRAYAFLSQIFDYGNTDFEKRSIFFRHLNRILKFDREREEIDLTGVVLTHHNLKSRGEQKMRLADEEYPTLAPLGEVGSGEVREKQTAYLSEIITKLNDLFGSDTTDGDQLSFVKAITTKMTESELLRSQAIANTK